MKRHQKLLSMMLSSVVALSMFPVFGSSVSAATAAVAVNATNFPDAVFRKFILEKVDKNGNKKLEETERTSISGFSLYDDRDNKLANLKGIELFPNLTSLNLSSDGIKSVNVSKNTKLRSFSVDSKNLASIDVSKLTALESISLYGAGKVKSVDLSNNKKVRSIYLDDCKALTSLKIGNPANVTRLDISNTALKNINFTSFPKLEWVAVNGCKGITNLNVNAHAPLEYAWFGNSGVSSFDATKYPKLKVIYGGNSKITKINVTKCTQLEELSLNNTKITAINVTKNTKLEELDLGYTKIKSLDISKNTVLDTLHINGAQISKLNVTNNKYIKWLLKNGDKEINSRSGFVCIDGKPTASTYGYFIYNGFATTLVDGKTVITPYPKGYVEPNKEQYAFVERMYTTCMKRESDPEGKQYWAAQLAMHKITGEYVGAFFFLSDEMVNMKLSDKEFVTRLYKTFMDRDPEKGGFEFWLKYLKEGHSRADVVYGFTRSAEFVNRCKKADIIPYK